MSWFVGAVVMTGFSLPVIVLSNHVADGPERAGVEKTRCFHGYFIQECGGA